MATRIGADVSGGTPMTADEGPLGPASRTHRGTDRMDATDLQGGPPLAPMHRGSARVVVFETASDRVRSRKPARRCSQSSRPIASHEEPSRLRALRHFATLPRERRHASPVWPARWLVRRENRPEAALSSRRRRSRSNAVPAPSVRRSPRRSASSVVTTVRTERPPTGEHPPSRNADRESGIDPVRLSTCAPVHRHLST